MKNIKPKNKNKKKLWLFVIPIVLAVSLVGAAVVTNFFSGETTIEVTQPISVSGNTEYTTDNTLAGQSVLGDLITATSIADDNRQAQITSTEEEGITTTYVNKLKLTKKDTTTWQPIPETEIEITYTVVGDTFEFSGVPEDYTLIYYKDVVVGLEGRLNNPQPAITITGDIGTFPHTDDANMDELANYCESPDEYDHCKGAKVWVVPTSDIIDNNLNWANMNNYYYETDLIYYFDNTDGIITIPANSYIDFYPLFDLDENLATGEYTITTNVLPY